MQHICYTISGGDIMATKHPRIHLVLEKPLYKTIEKLADKNDLSLSSQVRDLILDSLRQFRGQYTTTTEIEPSASVSVPITEQEFQKEMLAEIREIKELLSR